MGKAPPNESRSSHPHEGFSYPASWLFFGLAVLVSTGGAAPFDLDISLAIANTEDGYGVVVQNLGTLPALFLYVIAIVWLAVPTFRKRDALISRAASAVLVQALVHTMFAMNLLKLLWGRERFASIAAGGAEFSPLWELHPGAGGMSFPSGHVATALVLLPVAYILATQEKRLAAFAVTASSAVYAIAIAYGRIRFGAHFLSDTLFAAGTSILMAPLSASLGDRYLGLFERAVK